MAKERFILRYTGRGKGPKADVARVRALEEAVVVDESPRMLLVEAEPEPLRAMVETLPDWVMGPERTYAVPDTRRKIRRAPD